jgi:uncharacterized protein
VPAVLGTDVQRLRQILVNNDWFMDVLRTVRQINPTQWVVGSGVIRNAVWDQLHGFTEPTPTRDVDVAYFDEPNIDRQRDQIIAAQLQQLRPDVPWEVKNQAGVHLWYETRFGRPIAKASSITDAISMWPETATSVGVRLLPHDSLHVVAPCGLDDLLGMVLRRNKRQIPRELFSNGCATSAYRRSGHKWR